MTHICVGNLTIIGPDNGLSPGRHQAIIWTNAGILLIGPWGTNFSDILIGIRAFSFKKTHLKMSSAKWRPFYLGLHVLTEPTNYQKWSKWPSPIPHPNPHPIPHPHSLTGKDNIWLDPSTHGPWVHIIGNHGSLFTKWTDVLPQDFLIFRWHELRV